MTETLTCGIVLFGQAEDGGIGVLGFLIWLTITVLIVAGFWKVFEKAGLPGWGALIPIYNLILWMRLAGRPGWWVLLLLIPLVNFIISIIVHYDVAQKFGKGVGFAMGLMFLPFIFYPILGFGSAQYNPTLARLRQQAALA
jgi:hypothetical protein